MKRRIASAFSEYIVQGSADLDRRRADIRKGLTEEYGRPIVFWEDEIKGPMEPDHSPMALDDNELLRLARYDTRDGRRLRNASI
jgi:hypothetical protein